MKTTRPDAGDSAPAFSLPNQNGETVSLADFGGKTLILYFYPRDDTSGCTKQAIGFTESGKAFAAAGATVVGVSKDSVASHTKFIAKHDLTVPLLSDENDTTCEDYGVWVEKKMYGKTFMGIERTTFLIRDDQVVKVWRKVKVPGHVEEVLSEVAGL